MTLLAIEALAGDLADELVAAHPHVAVQVDQRDHRVVAAQGSRPREGVVVVGVDEGAVDVQDGDGPVVGHG